MEFPYKKVLLLGCSGAGKSVLSRWMGPRFGLPVVHLDQLYWLPGWVHRTRDEFDALLAQELEKPAWIMDGNFDRTFPVRLRRADFCIYLDLDTDTCLAGAHARWREYEGRTRPDMTEGCPEKVDPEFEDWIRDFNAEIRPGILQTMADSGVPYRIFTSREEVYGWLEQFEQA